MRGRYKVVSEELLDLKTDCLLFGTLHITGRKDYPTWSKTWICRERNHFVSKCFPEHRCHKPKVLKQILKHFSNTGEQKMSRIPLRHWDDDKYHAREFSTGRRMKTDRDKTHRTLPGRGYAASR